MREIEFRAFIEYKNLDCGFPDYTLMMNVHSIDFVRGKLKAGNINETYKIEDVKLIQYTGIKDKNGVKIFEGDIVKDEHKRLFVIEYKFGGFNIVPINCYNDEFSWNPLGDMQTAGWLNESAEIIGNIYENKELLEVK